VEWTGVAGGACTARRSLHAVHCIA
jgi:hypothetical protein